MDEDLDGEEDAILVEEGIFKIDRRRALDKLMRYQLPDPAMFVLLLVRCAAASGASAIGFEPKPSGRGFVVRFDGEPFDANSLGRPYACLFTRPTAAVRRDRQLAVALLSMLRLTPDWITVRSGRGKSRVLLRIASLTEESLDAAPDGGLGTVVTVSGPALTKAHGELLRARCRLSPIPIAFLGEKLPRADLKSPDGPRFVYESDGLRGWFEIPERLETHSNLRASRYGVFVSNIRHRLPIGQVVGSFNADALTVSASQFGIVRNSRYKKTLAAVGRQVETFALRELVEFTRALPRLSNLLADGHCRSRWGVLLDAAGPKRSDRRFLSWLDGVLTYVRVAPDVDRFLQLCARRVVWLREAARRLCLGDEKKGFSQLRDQLREAPLFFSSSLQRLSLSALEAQRKRIGYVPTSRGVFGDLTTAFKAVWLTGSGDAEVLERFFATAVSDSSSLLERESELSSARGGRRRSRGPAPRLERVGLASFLNRIEIGADGLTGEVALPFHRFPDGARIHVFDLGRPYACADIPGRLRFAAAVEGETRSLTAQRPPNLGGMPPALRNGILSLYRSGAGNFQVKYQGHPRQESLRAHLFDFLLWACDGGSDLVSGHSWAAKLPLFAQQGGDSWSYESLLKTYESGVTLFFALEGGNLHGVPDSILFTGEQFSEKNLDVLFPGCACKQVPGRSEVLMLYTPGSEPDCAAWVSKPSGKSAVAPAAKTADGDRTALVFNTKMLVERELEGDGLRARLGFPPDLLPGLLLTVKRDGKFRRYTLRPKGLSAAATLLIDAGEWEVEIEGGGLHPRFENAVLSLYNRFLYGVLDMLVKASVESKGYEEILLYLLYHLRGDTPNARKEGPRWSPLRERIRGSALIATLGGTRASLADLAESARAAGKLVYAVECAVGAGEDAGMVPVLRYPRLVAQLLGGVSLKKYKKPVKAAVSEEEALNMFTPQQRLENELRGLLRALNGHGENFEFAMVRSKAMLSRAGGRLRVNRDNPLVAKILSAKLTPEEKAQYLASLVFSAVNREERGVTDLEDTRLQRSLAHEAAGA